MHRPTVVSALTILVLVGVSGARAQPSDNDPIARTVDGQPDISGIFTFRTLTPLQRPTGLDGRTHLSEEEAAEWEASENRRLNRDLFDPEKGAPSAGYAPRSEGGVLSYNEFWYERGVEMVKDKRTSLIIDPPDGRIPWSEAGRQWRRARSAHRREHATDSHLERSLFDRCIMGFNSGPPMMSSAYNNNVHILQAPGTVAILNEMVHNARIIPLDDRQRSGLPQYAGESRGHWQGRTLVVETKGFLRETSLTGSSADTVLTERFTRIDPDTVMYEFTVEDPHFDRPWTAMMPLRRLDGTLFEYACHEGNYAMTGILAGAREKERQAAEAATARD